MKGLKLILLLAATLVEAGCGLPDQYFIQSPILGTFAGGTGNQFNFLNPDHTKDLNITFKGYELYYQFYPQNATININPYDPNNTADVYTQLTTAGYKLMTSSADLYPNRTDPVIPIAVSDIGSSFSVTVQITTAVTPPAQAAQYTTTASTLGFGNLRRNVQDATIGAPYYPNYKDFQYNIATPLNYAITDQDCGNILSFVTGSGNYVWIAVFAASYGLIGVSTPQRSVPIYLGYLTVQIN
ncbi:MAG: hypothetical protein ABSG63_13660 [Spirochaetia bacterium]|jgi:hypothetical protein